MWKQRLKLFLTFFDSRFEDLNKKNWIPTVYRDFSAGLIVALTAIPLAMGFAMAMGLRPEQGIIAGALACLVGRIWGGSKYQVYGPTAAFIPIIYSLMQKYQLGHDFAYAHGMLVLVSMIAGIVLMLMGLAGLGKIVQRFPYPIVIGFTIGIAVTIVLSNIGDILGLRTEVKGDLFEKLKIIYAHLNEFNIYALLLGLLTFILSRYLLKISVFIPAPLIALAVGMLVPMFFNNTGLILIKDKYGHIPTNFFVFTPPTIPDPTWDVCFDILYYVAAIIFVSGIESLLCSTMADQLAQNKKTPFNPDKEFWGQGLVQVIVPMINGFPCTGALARTATSIKAGAVTPLAGFFKGVLKLILAYYLASWLEKVPMTCIGGILLWVASNMINPNEIRHVFQNGKYDAFLMTYTAVMVPLTDFLTGVLSALAIYAIGNYFTQSPAPESRPSVDDSSKDITSKSA
ncbi:MAG: SulP family inorganic anion transporter [Planctomycetota bacterium]